MIARAASFSSTWPRWPLLGGGGLVIALVGAALVQGAAPELTYITFIALSGLAMGSLGILMIGHLMNERWVTPIRSEAEAAGLTMPLLLFLGTPLALNLGQLFPWATDTSELPALRATFLSSGFFILRSLVYLAVCSGLAVWLTRTRHLRRTSAVGLTLLTPVMTFAAYDWVLSRDPQWWSSLFGFAYAMRLLLAALAGAILITLLKPEHTAPKRLMSLERTLLTLSLLSIWTWFAQFLIVWLTNLPHEALWYLKRSDTLSLWLFGTALAVLLAAILILIPSGVSRRGMIVGSALVLLQHAIHLVWILQPWRNFGSGDAILALASALLWGIAFTMLMRTRPSDADEMQQQS